MRTISILNLKGGVGKTFTAANMGYELWRRNFRVLLFDNDKQGNLSRAYGKYSGDKTAPAAKVLSGAWKSLPDIIEPTAFKGMDMIASNMSLFGAAWNLAKQDEIRQTDQYRKLFQTLDYLKLYDFCLIDDPPDLGLNVISALSVSDEVIVPVKIDEDALEGLDIVAEQIEDARAFNSRLRLTGVLITDFQNTDGEAAGLEWLRQQGRYEVLGTIRHSKKVAESSFMRKPIYEYSPCCAAAQGYKKFVTEFTGKGR